MEARRELHTEQFEGPLVVGKVVAIHIELDHQDAIQTPVPKTGEKEWSSYPGDIWRDGGRG